jgi:hypothetical protein
MKKLGRFTVVAFAYIVLFVVAYCIIPTIAAIFGADFLQVAQNPMHVLFAGVTIMAMLGVVFNECFDSDFCAKN